MGRKKRPDLQHEAHTLPRGVPVDEEWLRERNQELEAQGWSGPNLRDYIAWLNRQPLDEPLALTPLQFWYHLDDYVQRQWSDWYQRVGQKTVTTIELRSGKVISEATPRPAKRQYQPRPHTIRDSLGNFLWTWKGWEFIWYLLRGEYQSIHPFCLERRLGPTAVIRRNYSFLRLHWSSLSENLERAPRTLAAEKAGEKYHLDPKTIQSRWSLSKWPCPGITFQAVDRKEADVLTQFFTPSTLKTKDFEKFFAKK